LAFFLLPLILALALARHDDHLDGGVVAILISVALGMPVLWLTWATYRESRRSGGGGDHQHLAELADWLADAVRAQWKAEADMRRLNEPYPLPVSWRAANASLTVSWDSLVRLARTGAGWPQPAPAGAWAVSPAGLSGADNDLVDVLAKIPTGRLVVLGEPGSGKTMLMVRLVLDMLARRSAGGPVPILASLASWNPAEQNLDRWLTTQLVTDHPALGAAAPGKNAHSLAEALIAASLITPILDGLDEIPAQKRGRALSRINNTLRPGTQLVVTSRKEEYQDATRPKDGVEVKLRATAAVELRPLDAAAVREYLRDDSGGPVTAARWDPVLAMLGTRAPAGQALSTPLMVGLARIIYNPRPGEQPRNLREPAELCNPGLADRAAVESHLFDAFVPAAYRFAKGGRWTAEEAEKWLVFLAEKLGTIETDLAPWRTDLFRPERDTNAYRYPKLLIPWPLAGFMVATIGAIAGVLTGRVSLMHASVAASIAIGLGVFGCLVIGMIIAWWRTYDPEELWAVFLGASRVPDYSPPAYEHVAAAASPSADLARCRNADLVDLLTFLPAFFLACAGPGGIAGFLAGSLAGGLVGGLVGVLIGVLLYRRIASRNFWWLTYTRVRVRLALRRQLPWALMSFLGDAHRKGVLRQAGTAYQFRHLELQRRLATRPKGPRQVRQARHTTAMSGPQ
jgi:hypothetical protein